MSVNSGQVVTGTFTTRQFTTGALASADSLPTAVLVKNGADTAQPVTVALVSTGRYTFSVTMPTVTAADIVEVLVSATVGGVSDRAVVWTDTVDALNLAVPGSYASGTAGYALGRIGSGQIETTSVVAQGGLVTLESGDDYYADHGRALDWTDADASWPNLTGATAVSFRMWDSFTDELVLTVAGTVVVSGGSSQQVRAQVPRSVTANLAANSYAYTVNVTLLDGHVVTLVRGTATVHAGNL